MEDRFDRLASRFDTFGLESPFANASRLAERQPYVVDEGGYDEADAQSFSWEDELLEEDEGLAWLDAPEALAEDQEFADEHAGEQFEDEGCGCREAAFETDFAYEEDEWESGILEGFDSEWRDLDPAESIDEAAAQPPFHQSVRARIEAWPEPAKILAAIKWNTQYHPALSGISPAVLTARLAQYLNQASIEQAMRANAGLAALASDPGAVLAVLVHQFQSKILAPPPALPGQNKDKLADLRNGKAGEGTLDALGFVRHRGKQLNSADQGSVAFHVGKSSQAYARLKEAHKANPAVFASLGKDVTPKSWYYLFVSPPFLGKPFRRGISLEMIRRLRLAERWLLTNPRFRDLSPAEIGLALGLDEDHRGGRINNKASMHTLGLAVDIGYVANPWVAGQANSPGRNSKFQAATQNAALLLTGKPVKLTSAFLSSLGRDPALSTAAVYDRVRALHDQLVNYLALEKDPVRLRQAIELRQREGGDPKVFGKAATTERKIADWLNTIRQDRAQLKEALQGGSARNPAKGFLNLDRDLVIALRDHACLAWGGVDLGGNQSGDMMHFDCRSAGIGHALALPKQRTADGFHPCNRTLGNRRDVPSQVRDEASPWASFSGLESSQVFEQQAPADTTPAQPLEGGLVWSGRMGSLGLDATCFLTPAAQQADQLEVLVYIHGLLHRCVSKTTNMQKLLVAPEFGLARTVVQSGRPLLLIVPRMQQALVNGSWKSHRLGEPLRLNALVSAAIDQAARHAGKPYSHPRSTTLAGHSKGYAVIYPLIRKLAADPQSLAEAGPLQAIWLLDASYPDWGGGYPKPEIAKLATSLPDLRIVVAYRPKTSTDRFTGRLKTAWPLRVAVPGPVSHCGLPKHVLPGLLAARTNAAMPVAGEFAWELEDEDTEFEDTDFEDTEFEDTEFEDESFFAESLADDEEWEANEFEADAFEAGASDLFLDEQCESDGEADTSGFGQSLFLADEAFADDEDYAPEADQFILDPFRIFDGIAAAGEALWLYTHAKSNGIADRGQLANALFFHRHPERQGKPIDKNDPAAKALAAEWITIRDRIATPMLGLLQSPAPSAAASPSTASVGPASAPAKALGSLPLFGKGRVIKRYQFTQEDLEWLAKMVVWESGGSVKPEDRAVVQCVINRYAVAFHRRFASFAQFLRVFSTTLQPVLRNRGAAERHFKGADYVKTGGFYDPPEKEPYANPVPKGQLGKHLKVQRAQWSDLPIGARTTATLALTGAMPNPGIGNADNFASTRVYFKQRHKGAEPTSQQWRQYTEAVGRKKGRWIGDVPNLDQTKNAFFLSDEAVLIPAGAIKVQPAPA